MRLWILWGDKVVMDERIMTVTRCRLIPVSVGELFTVIENTDAADLFSYHAIISNWEFELRDQ